MVNWINAPLAGPHSLEVDGARHELDRIATHLQLHADVSEAGTIRANRTGTSMGVIFGHDAFQLPATSSLLSETTLLATGVIRPVAAATAMLTGKMASAPDYCVYIVSADTEVEARTVAGNAFEHLRRNVLPYLRERSNEVSSTNDFAHWMRAWWKPQKPRRDFFTSFAGKTRYIACSSPQARPIFVFLSSHFVPTNTLQVFAFDDDYSFGIIQSQAHWAWLQAKGGKVRQDIRYTNDVWTTFPWPQEVSEEAVVRVAAAGRELRATRERLMAANRWTLRALHQAAEVDGPHPLKDAQRALDEAVAEAYGIPSDQELTEFLLELNRALVDDEAAGRAIAGPGLPPGFDRKDPRWNSDDCIQPPSLSES